MGGFRKVCLIGLDGLVGSFALGLRRSGFRGGIVAVAPVEVVEAGWKLGMITDGFQQVAEAAAGADLIMLSRETAGSGMLAEVLAAADEAATISEMTRVKQEVHRVFAKSTRTDLHYVGFRLIGDTQRQHQLTEAGKFYFEGKTIILTPRGKEDLEAYSTLNDALRKMGALVIAMSPQAHDRLLAQLAHVPRITAMALLQRVFDPAANYELTPAMLGDWLADQARMLAGDREWIAEIEDNRELVLEGIEQFIQQLQQLKADIAGNKLPAKVEALSLLTGKTLGMTEKPREFSLVVATGGDSKVLEQTSRLLAEARIKIKSLDPLRFAEAGTFRLTLQSLADRDGAVALLQRSGIDVEETG